MTKRSFSRREALVGGGSLALLGLPVKDFAPNAPFIMRRVAGPPANGPRFPDWGAGKGPFVGQTIHNDAGDASRDLNRQTWARSGLNCIGTANLGKLRQGVWSNPRGGPNGRGIYDWGKSGSGDIPARLAYQETTPLKLWWSVHAGHWHRSVPKDYGWTPATWQLYATDHIREMWNAFRPYADRIVRFDIVNEPIHARGGSKSRYMNREARGAPHDTLGYWEAANRDPSWTEGADNWPRMSFRVAKAVGIPKNLCYLNQFGCTIAHNAFGAADQGTGAMVSQPAEFVASRFNNREVMSSFNSRLYDGYINLAERIIDNGGAGDGHIGGIGFQHHTDADLPFDRQLFEWQMADCLRLELQVAVTELNSAMNTQQGFGYPSRGLKSSVFSAQYLYHIIKAYLTYSDCTEITVWAPTRGKRGHDFFPLYLENRPTLHLNALARATWEAKPAGQRVLKPRKTWFLHEQALPLGVKETAAAQRDKARGGWRPNNGGLDLGGWPWRRRGGRYEPFPTQKWCFEGTFFKHGGDAGEVLVVADRSGGPICVLAEAGNVVTLTRHGGDGARTQTYALGAGADRGFFAFVLAYERGTFRFCMRHTDRAFADPATLEAAIDTDPARIFYGGGNGVGGRNLTVLPLSLYPAEVAPIDTAEMRAICTVKQSSFLTRSEIEAVDLDGWHDGEPWAI